MRISTGAFDSESWRIGDRLVFTIPQLGATYRPTIDEIDDGPGARAFLGKIAGPHGLRRRFVVTVGHGSLFAYIDTSQGSYEMAAYAEYGWLVPSTSMMASFDFTAPDYILPEHGRTRPSR